MAITVLSDIGHFWGGDVQLGPTGDLGLVDSVLRSKQRVLRRMLTNPGDYVWHPDYGAGLPLLIGKPVDPAATAALIQGQMRLENTVAQDQPITVKVTPITNGMSVVTTYTVLPDRQPVALSFNVSE